MGDYSYAEFHIPMSCREAALELFDIEDWELGDETDEYFVIYHYESRGGGWELHETLVSGDIPHYYESGECAGMWEASVSYHIPGEGTAQAARGGPVAPVKTDGTVDQAYIYAALEWYRLQDLFTELFGSGGFLPPSNGESESGDALDRL